MQPQAEPPQKILKPDHDPAAFERLKQVAEEWRALQGLAMGDSVPSETLFARLSAAEGRIKTLMVEVFKDCTELGPPKPITTGQLPNGDLVWVCGHDPQHLYDFQTGKLLP